VIFVGVRWIGLAVNGKEGEFSGRGWDKGWNVGLQGGVMSREDLLIGGGVRGLLIKGVVFP